MADTQHTRTSGKAQADATYQDQTNGDITAADWRQEQRDIYESVPVLSSANTFTETNTFTGKISVGDASELTIATGAVTVTNGFHKIDTEADASTDDLDTINGGVTGMILYLVSANSARDTTLKDGTGNLALAGDFTLSSTSDTITLIYDGANWLEVSRSNNA